MALQLDTDSVGTVGMVGSIRCPKICAQWISSRAIYDATARELSFLTLRPRRYPRLSPARRCIWRLAIAVNRLSLEFAPDWIMSRGERQCRE